MPPKKKAKKTQTVSLDKRTQAKMLRDKASAFEAEATVEERIHELLQPAKVSANTFLLKVFHEKASAEVMLSHKKKAYLDVGIAIKECEHEITSGEEAMKLKGVGKSSAELIDKALVPKKFFDIENTKGVREAVASLPKDAEIRFGGYGYNLCVNDKCREDFHARGCPWPTKINGVKYMVDGTTDYSGCMTPKLKFSGTLTNMKNKKMYDFSFFYKLGSHSHDGIKAEDELNYDWKGDFEDEDINEIVRTILSNYEFGSYYDDFNNNDRGFSLWD